MSKLEISPVLLEALQKLSTLLESDDVLIDTLQCIAQLPKQAIAGCDSAGVTLRVDGEVMTAAASDDFTLEIDKIQYATHQGPAWRRWTRASSGRSGRYQKKNGGRSSVQERRTEDSAATCLFR